MNYKIREHALQKIPFTIIVGKKEIENETVSIRVFGEQNQETIKLDDFLKKIKNSCRMPWYMSNWDVIKFFLNFKLKNMKLRRGHIFTKTWINQIEAVDKVQL